MPTRDQHDIDEDDDDFDPEGPDPSEMDSHDDPDLDVCPYCRKMISEEAERCPHCGQYITAEQPASWTFAYVALAVAVGIAVLLVFFMRDSR